MSGSATSLTSTPLPIIAHVSRVAIRVSDLVTGDRSDYPLLVSFACARALGFFGIESHVLYGHAAWVEVLENHSVAWAQSRRNCATSGFKTNTEKQSTSLRESRSSAKLEKPLQSRKPCSRPRIFGRTRSLSFIDSTPKVRRSWGCRESVTNVGMCRYLYKISRNIYFQSRRAD